MSGQDSTCTVCVNRDFKEVLWRKIDFRVNRVGGAILSVLRQDWLQTSTGVNVVAVGLLAIMFSVILFTVQDFWILFADKLYVVHGLRVFGTCFGQL